ncbi:hypothetical protein Tsubulata_024197 [Turnera subulata]|uniref:CCHC-type domain-containing protein n=1 Tax=Turnera subulata TaxID=218843 RepID=A0A9Q0FXP1_9ROSI|nr:hypothetical protein Tsubulata_024197 [Turnera subulata]
MLHKRWENTLIVKMWGRNIGYKTLCNRLPNLWKLKESVRVVDLENNFYFVRFQNRFDYLRALTDGPWTVLGHYLTVELWKPQFNPLSHKITSIVAWIQIPQLSSEYYDRGLLHAVCKEIGHFVRLDQNTAEALRGRYARVAVELDLSKPLQSQVLVDGTWYLISYENIPDICFECGLVGHVLSACPHREPNSKNPKEVTMNGQQGVVLLAETHSIQQPSFAAKTQPRGEWMIAGRRRRPPRAGSGQSNKETQANKETNNGINSSSRFDVLQDYITVDRPTATNKGKEILHADLLNEESMEQPVAPNLIVSKPVVSLISRTNTLASLTTDGQTTNLQNPQVNAPAQPSQIPTPPNPAQPITGILGYPLVQAQISMILEQPISSFVNPRKIKKTNPRAMHVRTIALR